MTDINKHIESAEKPKAMTKEEFADLMGCKSVRLTEKVKNKLIELDKELGLCFYSVNIENFFEDFVYFFFRKSNMHLTGSGKGNYHTISEEEFLSWFPESNNDQTTIVDISGVKVKVEQDCQIKPKKTRKQFLIDLNKQMDKNKKEFIETHEKREKEIHTELTCENAWIDEDGKYRIEQPVTSEQMKIIVEWFNNMERLV